MEMSIAEWNRVNRAFWGEQKAELERKLNDERIAKYSYKRLAGEEKKAVADRENLYVISTEIETQHEEAVEQKGPELKKRALREQARKGGAAKPGDALQRLLESIVTQHITFEELLNQLRDLSSHRIIDDVTAEEVAFTDPDRRSKDPGKGRSKSVTMDALGDRFWRAKKKMFPQLPASAIQRRS